jgi:hypothetical protein
MADFGRSCTGERFRCLEFLIPAGGFYRVRDCLTAFVGNLQPFFGRTCNFGHVGLSWLDSRGIAAGVQQKDNASRRCHDNHECLWKSDDGYLSGAVLLDLLVECGPIMRVLSTQLEKCLATGQFTVVDLGNQHVASFGEGHLSSACKETHMNLVAGIRKVAMAVLAISSFLASATANASAHAQAAGREAAQYYRHHGRRHLMVQPRFLQSGHHAERDAESRWYFFLRRLSLLRVSRKPNGRIGSRQKFGSSPQAISSSGLNGQYAAYLTTSRRMDSSCSLRLTTTRVDDQILERDRWST